MYKLTVLYNHPEDTEAFERYYEEHHLPLARSMEGVSRVELTRFIRTPAGENPEYYRMAEIFFVNEQQMIETMGSPAGQEVINDTHNFATNGWKFLIGMVTVY